MLRHHILPHRVSFQVEKGGPNLFLDDSDGGLDSRLGRKLSMLGPHQRGELDKSLSHTFELAIVPRSIPHM